MGGCGTMMLGEGTPALKQGVGGYNAPATSSRPASFLVPHSRIRSTGPHSSLQRVPVSQLSSVIKRACNRSSAPTSGSALSEPKRKSHASASSSGKALFVVWLGSSSAHSTSHDTRQLAFISFLSLCTRANSQRPSMEGGKTVLARRLSRSPSMVNLPDSRKLAADLLGLATGTTDARHQTPLESDIGRRIALVQRLKVLAAGDFDGSGQLAEAIRCLHDLFDATIGSDDTCAALARDGAAIAALDGIARLRSSTRLASAQALALRILVNVSSLKAGASDMADMGCMATFLDQVRTLRMTSSLSQRETGIVALRGICNLIAGTGGCCRSHVEASKVVSVTLTISRDSDELCQNVCMALASIASTADGASSIIDARGHKALFSSLLKRGQMVSQFINGFNSEDDAKCVSELQTNALWALRNLSSIPVGRERLSTDLPALVAVATIFTHTDDMIAVEHASAMLANLVKTEIGLHLAMAASTCNFMLNVLEIGLFIEDFAPGNHALCVLLNISKDYEGLQYCLQQEYHKPIGGLLTVQQDASTACTWCKIDLVLGVLVNLTSNAHGRELVVLDTAIESTVLQVALRYLLFFIPFLQGGLKAVYQFLRAYAYAHSAHQR